MKITTTEITPTFMTIDRAGFGLMLGQVIDEHSKDKNFPLYFEIMKKFEPFFKENVTNEEWVDVIKKELNEEIRTSREDSKD